MTWIWIRQNFFDPLIIVKNYIPLPICWSWNADSWSKRPVGMFLHKFNNISHLLTIFALSTDQLSAGIIVLRFFVIMTSYVWFMYVVRLPSETNTNSLLHAVIKMCTYVWCFIDYTLIIMPVPEQINNLDDCMA